MSKCYLLFLFLVIASCSRSQEAAKLDEFAAQKKNYILIVEKLSKFQKIESVEPALKFESVQNSMAFDSSTTTAYKELKTMVEGLGLRKVVAIRNLDTRELLGVSFVMPFRFLDWGNMEQIKYIDSQSSVESFIPPGATCKLIESPNWYFCNYNTQ